MNLPTKLALAFVLFAATVIINAFEVDTKRSDYWRVFVDGVETGGPFSTTYTARDAATNELIKCPTCDVRVNQPDLIMTAEGELPKGDCPDVVIPVCPAVVICPEEKICPAEKVCPEIPPEKVCPDVPNPLPPLDPKYTDITLEWSIPVLRENGDALALSELCCYMVEWKTGSSATQTILVQGGGETTYQLENFAPGTWDIRIYAIDTGGLHSAPSDWVSFTIDPVILPGGTAECDNGKPTGFTATYDAEGTTLNWDSQCGDINIVSWDQTAVSWKLVKMVPGNSSPVKILWGEIDGARTNVAGECGWVLHSVLNGVAGGRGQEIWTVPQNGECSK